MPLHRDLVELLKGTRGLSASGGGSCAVARADGARSFAQLGWPGIKLGEAATYFSRVETRAS